MMGGRRIKEDGLLWVQAAVGRLEPIRKKGNRQKRHVELEPSILRGLCLVGARLSGGRVQMGVETGTSCQT